MFHTDRDVEYFFIGLLTIVGTGMTALLAVSVGIALFRKTYRSPRRLMVTLGLAILFSIPLIVGLTLGLQMREEFERRAIGLPDPLDDWPMLKELPPWFVVFLPQSLLLAFAWIAPIWQYRTLRNVPPPPDRTST